MAPHLLSFPSMNCPACQAPNLITLETRHALKDSVIRRRRKCESCSHLLTTYEIPEQNLPQGFFTSKGPLRIVQTASRLTPERPEQGKIKERKQRKPKKSPKPQQEPAFSEPSANPSDFDPSGDTPTPPNPLNHLPAPP